MKNKKYYEIKKCKNCGKEFESLISRKQKFCCCKCSSEYTSNDKSRVDKIKQTKRQRYGDANYVNHQKAKQTCIQKYGVDNASKSQAIKHKIIQTNIEKYGVDYYFQSSDIKRKIKDKYNVDNISQLKHVKNKVRKTVNEKYGVDNVFQSDVIKSKIKQSYMEKYGCEYPSQSIEIQNKKQTSYKKTFYHKLQSTHKLNIKVEPLFDIEEYINSDRQNKYKFGCLKCGNIFYDHIDGGHLPRCITCYPLSKGSICEKEIYDYICSITNGDSIQQNVRNVISDKELDIYISNMNIAIEYDSLYYHSFGVVGKQYHLEKTKACERLGIRLIHIFEDEWVNKQEIVKSKLRNILGCRGEKIYARNCHIKHISTTDKNNFLNDYHIQGSDKSKIKLGCYHNDGLVAVMTFGKNRISLGNTANENEYELIRFATSKNVIGGASKLFSYFIKTYKPSKVISYADRRYSWRNNSVYNKMGFVYNGETPPNYWYYKNGYNKRYHRYTFRKSELSKKLGKYDNSLTEYENMQNNGYDKIYDCGSLKYTWKPS